MLNKFPTSTFVITGLNQVSENKQVTANLTIKGVTQPVTFPAKIEVKTELSIAEGKLVIDRTDGVSVTIQESSIILLLIKPFRMTLNS